MKKYEGTVGGIPVDVTQRDDGKISIDFKPRPAVVWAAHIVYDTLEVWGPEQVFQDGRSYVNTAGEFIYLPFPGEIPFKTMSQFSACTKTEVENWIWWTKLRFRAAKIVNSIFGEIF